MLRVMNGIARFRWGDTLPQINMEAHGGPHMEDVSLIWGPSPLPCSVASVLLL